MINGARSLQMRPSQGDVVRDAAGNRFVVISVGMKYANVHVLNNPKMVCLVNLREVFPDNIPAAPQQPPELEQ